MPRTASSGAANPKRPRSDGAHVRMPAWLFYALTLLTLAGAVTMIRRGDFLAAFAILALSLSACVGFRVGLSGILSTVASLTAAVAFAPALGIRYEASLSQAMGTGGLANRVLSVAVAAVLISLVTGLVSGWLLRRVVFRRRTGQRLDGYGGLVFAVGETAVLLLLLLGGLLSFQAWHRAAGHPGNRATRTLDRWAATTRQSSLGPIVRDYNPFDHIAALAEMRRVPETMRRLAAPETLRRVMDDPRITEVRSDPDFVAALEEFRQTPGVQAVASGERQADGALLVTLLNDDALLRLLDHPDFLPRVREVLAELP